MSDVVIVGAGIAGIATAYHLARRGVSDIVLVDPREPLSLTSDRSGANYREWWPNRPMVELSRRSIQMMDELKATGGQFAMNRRGYLFATRDPVRAAALPGIAREYRSAGIDPIRIHRSSDDRRAWPTYQANSPDGTVAPNGADVILDRQLLSEIFPYLSSGVAGAIHARVAGTVDPVALGRTLLGRAIEAGAHLVVGEVVAIHQRGGRVEGLTVTTSMGPLAIDTGRLVNAAGPFVGRVAALVGIELPIAAVLQQRVLYADPLGVLAREAPFTIGLDPQELPWSDTERRELARSDATRRLTTLLPGGWHIKPDGPDARPLIKLGWALNQTAEEPVATPPVPRAFARAVLRAATSLVAGLDAYAAADPVAHDGGYYVTTPDDLPLIGPLAVNGAFVIGGLAGFGAMVSLAAGELAATWIEGGELPPLAAQFDPRRFDDPEFRSRRVPHRSSGAL